MHARAITWGRLAGWKEGLLLLPSSSSSFPPPDERTYLDDGKERREGGRGVQNWLQQKICNPWLKKYLLGCLPSLAKKWRMVTHFCRYIFMC